jgi:aspartate kinase
MNRLIMKFGGTSVMDVERMRQAAQIVSGEARSGKEVVVVVSAMGHTTDHLIDLANGLQSKPDKKELDNLLVRGEQIAAALLAMAIQAAGFQAKSFDGQEVGILTNSCNGSAQIQSINPQKIIDCLRQGIVPVVAGFQGKDTEGHWMTLGRGGSDTTAIALAAAVSAERCDIYTDVDGIYSCDPNLFKSSYKLDSIGYAEMLELAKNGAQVLNHRSVEIAMKNDVFVRVRSTFKPEDIGTLVARQANAGNGFTGIAIAKNRACIKLLFTDKTSANEKSSERAFRHRRYQAKKILRNLLTQAGIEFEIGRTLKDSAHQIALDIAETDLDNTLKILKSTQLNLNLEDMRVETNLQKLSVIGQDLSCEREVAAIQGISRAGIAISLICSTNSRLSFLIPAEARQAAIARLHENFCPLAMAS